MSHADVYNAAKIGATNKITLTYADRGNVVFISLVNASVNTRPQFPILFGLMTNIDGVYVRQRSRAQGKILRNQDGSVLTFPGINTATPVAGEVTKLYCIEDDPINSGDVFLPTVSVPLLFDPICLPNLNEYDYGSPIPVNTVIPVLVNSLADDTIAIDSFRTTTSGYFWWTCMSTLNIKKIPAGSRSLTNTYLGA